MKNDNAAWKIATDKGQFHDPNNIIFVTEFQWTQNVSMKTKKYNSLAMDPSLHKVRFTSRLFFD